MAMRLTGLMSGMDTEGIIKELVAAKQTKVDNAKKTQTKLEWKQDAWKELNSKIYKLYSSTLSDLRFSSSYVKKTTKVSNSNAVSVITGGNAVNGVQSLKIDKLAKTGYLTGNQINTSKKCTSTSTLTDSTADGGLGLDVGSKFLVEANNQVTEIEITEGMTIAGLTKELQNAGVNASFDEKNQRFFISSKNSGKENDFTLTATNADGIKALSSLGIASSGDLTKYNGQDAGSLVTQSKIDTNVANKLSDILSKEASVKKSTKDIASKLEKFNLKSATDISTDDLLAKIDTYKTTEEYEKLSDADKEILTGYEATLNENKASLEELQKYYDVQEDGTKVASTTLTQEITDKLNGIYEKLTSIGEWGANELTTANANAVAAGQRIAGTDSLIYLNGAKFESDSNTFEINGLTYTVNATTAEGEEITITTQDDTDGIYDMIKNFITKYNELISEMDKLYNASAAKGYEPLTEDEKSAMSDDAIEKWEQKIKDSLFRKDSTVYSVASSMKQIMTSGITMKDGSTKYLSSFGIENLGYFLAGDNEKGVFHIDGDPDDSSTASNADKLRSMIASDPDTVVEFFMGLSKNLYSKMDQLMARTEYSSAYTVYNDKLMKTEYDDYTKEIKSLEAKLKAYEDKWYSKFSAMETAMAKMQSNASAVTSLLGG